MTETKKPGVVVKPWPVALRIAKAIRRYNPEAANLYIDGFDRRNKIERAALAADLGEDVR